MKEIVAKTRCVPAGDNCPQRETSPKGITLISLAITIAIIIIIAGVSISAGSDAIENANVTRLNTELKVIHTKVNEIVEERRTRRRIGYLWARNFCFKF